MEWESGTIIKTNISKDNYLVLQTCVFEDDKYYLIANQENPSEMLIIKKIGDSLEELEIVREEKKIDIILKEISKE